MRYVVVDNGKPIYIQIYEQIKKDIVCGVYPYKTKLPSKRTLAQETGVSVVSVEHAYGLLCEEGYIEPKERSGYIVMFKKSDGFIATEKTEMDKAVKKAMLAKYPELSVSALSKTIRKILSFKQDVLLDRSPSFGIDELKTAIVNYLQKNKGISAKKEQVVIGAGAEYLYGMIINFFGQDKIYAIENPSYKKLEDIFKTRGVKYESLALSKDGIDSFALQKCKADILHTTPYRSYPTGVTATASKKQEYIKWADLDKRYIIEYDYGSEFSVFVKPIETLYALSNKDNVIYLNTFSKTVSPSVRAGYMVLPLSLVKPFYDKLGFYACSVSTLYQYVLAELISSGDLERHINRVRRKLRKEGENTKK